MAIGSLVTTKFKDKMLKDKIDNKTVGISFVKF